MVVFIDFRYSFRMPLYPLGFLPAQSWWANAPGTEKGAALHFLARHVTREQESRALAGARPGISHDYYWIPA
jgi:hypothetical protein